MTDSTPTRSALDDKVNLIFAGKVVRKVKIGANVPVFVLEHLLGKYCTSSSSCSVSQTPVGARVTPVSPATVTSTTYSARSVSPAVPDTTTRITSMAESF